MDRYGIAAHSGLLFLSVPPVVVVAAFARDPALLAVVVSIAGFATTGGLVGMNALLGFLFPTAIRSTGVGLTISLARVGMIVGPLLIGWMLSSGGDIRTIYRLSAIPLLLGSAGVLYIGLLDRPRFRREKAAQAAARA